MEAEGQPNNAFIPRRRWIWLELGAVSVLCFLPFFWWAALSILSSRSAPGNHIPADARVLENQTTYLRCLIPALFIVWTSGEGLVRFGIRKPKFWPGLLFVAIGLVIVVGVYEFALAMPNDPSMSRPSQRWIDEHGPVFLGLLFLRIFMTMLLWEFTTRGYLMTRLEDLGCKPWIGFLVSSAIYVAVHVSEGLTFVPLYAVLAIYGALSFRITKSIWPSAIALTLSMFCLAAINYVASWS